MTEGTLNVKHLILTTMCIIIYNRKGRLDGDMLKRASDANPDGAGMMYSVDGVLHVFKNMKNGKVIDEYFRVRKLYPEVAIGLHFRIRTDGLLNLAGCHPYRVNDKTSLMHNGIIAKYSGRGSAKSDTQLFIDDLLAKMDDDVLWSASVLSLISQAIGYGNKFLLFRKNGEAAILNEHYGHWDKAKNNWFSNDSHKPKNAKWDGNYNKYGTWKPQRVFDYIGGSSLMRCQFCNDWLISSGEIEHGTCRKCLVEICESERER